MDWQRALPRLRERLVAEGLPVDGQVVKTVRVAVPAVLTALAVAFFSMIVGASHPPFALAFAAVAVAAATGLVVMAAARASVVIAGDSWVATHNLLGWRLVRLAALRKVGYWSNKGTVYLRLWDRAGGYVSLNFWGMGAIRSRLAEWVWRAEQAGADVDPAAARLLGLPAPATGRRANAAIAVGALLLGLAVATTVLR